MKKLILKVLAVATLAGGVTGCGNDFLDTKYYAGIDVDSGLTNVTNIGTALNGTYYHLFHYYFAGNYATMIGDIASDITYFNGATGHFDDIYHFQYQDTNNYLYYIWNRGYKVIDSAARIIKAAEELEDLTTSEQEELDCYVAEAYALRAYATFVMTNIYGHQIKVNGTDYSSLPGIVIVDEPIEAFAQVERASVGDCYAAVLSDLNNAIAHFNAAGFDQGDLTYFNLAAVYGLKARVNLYMENWTDAATAAQNALAEAGIDELAYTESEYAALYATGTSNWESLFALGITSINNWSANSCGTLWTTYGYSIAPKLKAMYGQNDVRRTERLFAEGNDSNGNHVMQTGGKFSHTASGNSAYGTNCLINASEMFLIIAEANLRNSGGSLATAKDALMVVAKRNPDITENDLGDTKDAVLAFLKNECAREKIQEGHRLWDLRRWGEAADLYAYNEPNIQYTFTNVKVGDLIFPIPVDEVNAGFGVTQNDGWQNTRPN